VESKLNQLSSFALVHGEFYKEQNLVTAQWQSRARFSSDNKVVIKFYPC